MSSHNLPFATYSAWRTLSLPCTPTNRIPYIVTRGAPRQKAGVLEAVDVEADAVVDVVEAVDKGAVDEDNQTWVCG